MNAATIKTNQSSKEARPGLVNMRKTLLLCGVASALLYAAMLVIAEMLYAGYNSASQTVSELSAIGAPTRPLWISLGAVYNLLFIAFGWGVWLSAGRSRPLRTAGVLIAVSGVFGFFGTPMHQREVLAAGGGTLSDTIHIVWTIAWGTLTVLTMILGALALGKRFRIFSIVTMVVMLLFGILTSLDAPNLQANLPTPWMGLWERINIAAFLVWTIVFSVALLRYPESRFLSGQRVEARSANETEIHGFVNPGFEGVREAFAENFRSRNELGGACCIYHNGEKVVDLWGGIRNLKT